jgi:hypothetical protein
MTEIRSSSVLRVFGVFLAFTHLVTAYFWVDPYWGHVASFTDKFPICWPHLAGCEVIGRMTELQLFTIIGLYALLAAISGALFFRRETSAHAFYVLAIASVVKFALFQLDYRLSGNYHYMHFWTLAAYFLFPQKTMTLRFLIMSFYFGAGFLKVNKEWLSGAAIWDNPYLSGELLRLGCIYVMVLELFLIFGLWSRRRWIFWGTLGQLFLFHAVSYLIVSYYYPLMQMSLLSIYVLAERADPGQFYPSRLKTLPWPSLGLLVLFFVAQSIPFAMGGDRAIDGRGRIPALSMFDARAECEFVMTAKFNSIDGKLIERSLPRHYRLEQRLKCDPHVQLTDARHRCRSLAANPDFRSLDISLRSKRQTDADYRQVFLCQP